MPQPNVTPAESPATRTRMQRLASMVERHDFNLTDDKGRALGCAVEFSKVEFVAFTPEPGSWFCGYARPPGIRYSYRPQAMRGGRAYGACQEEKFFPTIAERDAAAARYVDGARKRAIKQWGARS